MKMPKMVERKCQCCKTPFMARAADVKRGWGKFCSKSCKAVKQEARTGQYKAYLANGSDYEDQSGIVEPARGNFIYGAWIDDK